MPVWLMPLLIKFVLPVVIQELLKAGVLSKVQASVISDLAGFVRVMSSLKAYQEFPVEKSRQDVPPHITNINKDRQ